jgi:GTP cyclohydrolase I
MVEITQHLPPAEARTPTGPPLKPADLKRNGEQRVFLDALNGLESAYIGLLASIPGALHEGTQDTPRRAAQALCELIGGYDIDIASLFRTFEPDGYDGMVVAAELPFVSMCEHHLLPFEGQASIVYIAHGRVIGFSKLPRLVQAFARRLQQQERMTVQIADTLIEHLDPSGVMVVIEATHSCMRCRGVRSNGVMRTSALRGTFRSDPAARQEAEWLIGRGS